jgi:hypothetical protein
MSLIARSNTPELLFQSFEKFKLDLVEFFHFTGWQDARGPRHHPRPFIYPVVSMTYFLFSKPGTSTYEYNISIDRQLVIASLVDLLRDRQC